MQQSVCMWLQLIATIVMPLVALWLDRKIVK